VATAAPTAPPAPGPARRPAPDAGPRRAAYTPKHLAEKVLKSRSALEGERRQVTVLFADLAGFTALDYPDRLADHFEELAHHFSQGEEWGKAFDYLARSGGRAQHAYANQAALSQARATASAKYVAKILALRGAVALAGGRWVRAEDDLAEGLDVARRIGHPTLVWQCAHALSRALAARAARSLGARCDGAGPRDGGSRRRHDPVGGGPADRPRPGAVVPVLGKGPGRAVGSRSPAPRLTARAP
jgi:class 3 adenylate cyclase